MREQPIGEAVDDDVVPGQPPKPAFAAFTAFTAFAANDDAELLRKIDVNRTKGSAAAEILKSENP